MKTLLAIVNELNDAKDYLRYVAGMAVNLGANVKVKKFHIPSKRAVGISDTFTGQTLIMEKEALKERVKESDKKLKEITNQISAEVKNGLFLESTAEAGFADLVADEMVQKKLVDMIVLEGEKKHNFWTQSPDNMDIIKKVSCPVWIIPKEATYKPFTEIIYATDYKKEDIVSLKKLIATFPFYAPNITALHITDSVDFDARIKKAGFVEMLQKETNSKSIWVRALYQNKHDDLTELINDYALKSKADLLVLLKENESFFERIFNTSHTTEILKKANIPVLVYHE